MKNLQSVIQLNALFSQCLSISMRSLLSFWSHWSSPKCLLCHRYVSFLQQVPLCINPDTADPDPPFRTARGTVCKAHPNFFLCDYSRHNLISLAWKEFLNNSNFTMETTSNQNDVIQSFGFPKKALYYLRMTFLDLWNNWTYNALLLRLYINLQLFILIELSTFDSVVVLFFLRINWKVFPKTILFFFNLNANLIYIHAIHLPFKQPLLPYLAGYLNWKAFP